MRHYIQNPIIRGFNPDPSIIRVDDTYYIANSTFEWFPGVQIHHSKDLENWELCSKPLDSIRLLDMKGAPDSCGVWAPCLSYSEGVYYLVYSNVKTFDGAWKDTPNYLVTTKDIINGPWSDPVFLDSSGFDASLFHDNDGRKWYLTLLVDHRNGLFFGGIGMQEYDPLEQKLIGSMKKIWDGSELGATEGPHIYKYHGYYYLMTAEGGTEYGHSVSLARSKSIDGPYELHPQNPILTARDNPSLYLQKTGHASLVETQTGEFYITCLVGRPLQLHGRCTLGRETAIQRVEWRDDNWLYLSLGGNEPSTLVRPPALDTHVWPVLDIKDDFDNETLGIHFNSLRIPIDEKWCSLKERKGFLRLYGQDSLCSTHNQSLIARRVQSFDVMVEAAIDFTPNCYHHMAGLVFYYNTMHFHYLYLSCNQEDNVMCLNVMTADNGVFREQIKKPIEITPGSMLFLRGHMNEDHLQFLYSLDQEQWLAAGPALDASILSDDYVREHGLHYRAAFTGTFVGICCQDLSGHAKHADFDYFSYEELN